MTTLNAKIRRCQKLFLILAFTIGATLAAGANSPANLQSEGLSAEQRRGQQIYLNGTSSTGRDIVATMANSAGQIPASYLACANCHGRDGAGKPEGGVSPSNITWESLTKPYGVVHPGGRRHPPYTEQLFKRAITLGVDPAGNKLHALMPHYQLSHGEAEDLIAYIKILGKHLDPGLSDTTIKVGATVITTGAFAEMSQSVKAVLAAYFDEVNKQGGIFNRRIEMQEIPSTEMPEDRIKAMRASIDNDHIFALVGVHMIGAEENFASLIKDKSVPMIGAFTLSPPVGLPPNPFGFYIYPGLKDHCRALAIFAADKYSPENPQAAIIYTGDEPTREAVSAIRSHLAKTGWNTIEEIQVQVGKFNAEQVVRSLSNKSTRAVFLLAPGDLQESILEQAQKADWRASYFIPGLLIGRRTMDASKNSADQLFLSVSSLPSDQTSDALAEYQRLVELYKLPAVHAASQMQALAAAKTFVEGLKRVGRGLSRQKLVEALEGIYQFKTGLTPPITFSPNRRIGSAGAYIVAIDKKDHRLVPVSKWIEPD